MSRFYDMLRSWALVSAHAEEPLLQQNDLLDEEKSLRTGGSGEKLLAQLLDTGGQELFHDASLWRKMKGYPFFLGITKDLSQVLDSRRK
jgi:hypothetical protein